MGETQGRPHTPHLPYDPHYCSSCGLYIVPAYQIKRFPDIQSALDWVCACETPSGQMRL